MSYFVTLAEHDSTSMNNKRISGKIPSVSGSNKGFLEVQ